MFKEQVIGLLRLPLDLLPSPRVLNGEGAKGYSPIAAGDGGFEPF